MGKLITFFLLMSILVYMLGTYTALSILENEDQGALDLFNDKLNEVNIAVRTDTLIPTEEGSISNVVGNFVQATVLSLFEFVKMGLTKGEELHVTGSALESKHMYVLVLLMGWIVIPFILLGNIAVYFVALVVLSIYKVFKWISNTLISGIQRERGSEKHN